MTIKQTEAWQKAVINSAYKWVNGEAAISSQEELVVIADYFGVKLPKRCDKFCYSNNPDHLVCYSAAKIIHNTLDKLATAIKSRTDDIKWRYF